MPKRSRKDDTDIKKRKGGGIVGAITQDVELTIEQAEDAAKKAARKAAVTLGIADVEVSEEMRALSRKPAAPAKRARTTRTSPQKPKRD
jgi:hypothetical protein